MKSGRIHFTLLEESTHEEVKFTSNMQLDENTKKVSTKHFSFTITPSKTQTESIKCKVSHNWISFNKIHLELSRILRNSRISKQHVIERTLSTSKK